MKNNDDIDKKAKPDLSEASLFEKYSFLKDTSLPLSLRKVLLEKSFESEAAGFARALEEKKWRWSTPLAIALTGLITIAANFLVDYSRGGAEADRKAAATRQESQVRILERYLFAYQDRPQRQRAEVLLFLVRAGVLNELKEEQLKQMANDVINEIPDATPIPSVGPLTSLSSPGTTVLDSSRNLAGLAQCIAAAGFKHVARYYAQTTRIPSKRLTPEEGRALSDAGLSIIPIYEDRDSTNPSSFSRERGEGIAKYVFPFARDVIKQPFGTAIFFSVNFDASADQIEKLIIPFFTALNDINKSQPDTERYRIGAYGSGRVLQRLRSAGLIHFSWLAQSTGWAGYRAATEEGHLDLRQLSSDFRLPCGVWGDANDLLLDEGKANFAFMFPKP